MFIFQQQQNTIKRQSNQWGDWNIAISVYFLKIMIVVLKALEESMHGDNTNFSRDEHVKREWNSQNKKI